MSCDRNTPDLNTLDWADLRPWLVVLQELIMSSDILEQDSSITPYTDAVKARQQQTVSMWTEVGWESPSIMPEQLWIKGTALPSPQGFSRLCEWMGKLLGRTIFRAERVAVCAKNLDKVSLCLDQTFI